ncbi:MAG: UbiA prenyltransferase [Rhodocyclaceae bacterium]|nr:UbiA prenyltransferase [Rhodocyclaceae bacterium]
MNDRKQQSSTDTLAAPRETARLLAPLHLMGPANALTAAADALGGITVAWGLAPQGITAGFWLLPLAAFLVYAGGEALRDVCDANGKEGNRPASPIPLGQISLPAALALSAALLVAGVFCAGLYSVEAGFLAAGLTYLIAFHHGRGQPLTLFSPLLTGFCRAGSLLLGMAASVDAIAVGWPLASIPVGYMFAVTVVSRGGGDGRNPQGVAALGMLVLVGIAYGFLAIMREQWPALVFVALFAALAWPVLVRAAEEPTDDAMRDAAKAGVLNLVVCNATLAATFAGPLSGLAILLLLPVSRRLARVFPVA